MRIPGSLVTTTLALLLAATAPAAYPQDREDKPSQQDEKDKNKDKAAKPDKTARPEEATRPEDRKTNERMDPGRKQNDRQPEAARPQEQRSGQDTDRSREQNHAQAQRGKRIPDDKFRASFGRQHTFRVQREQVVNNPQPVIVYGGYSFNLIDAWPEAWGFDDPVYVDYVDDGYYLFDPVHPEIRISVFIAE